MIRMILMMRRSMRRGMIPIVLMALKVLKAQKILVVWKAPTRLKALTVRRVPMG